jgi:hypothetical protein
MALLNSAIAEKRASTYQRDGYSLNTIGCGEKGEGTGKPSASSFVPPRGVYSPPLLLRTTSVTRTDSKGVLSCAL